MDAGNRPHEFLVLGLEKNTPLPVKVAEHKLLISLCIVEQVEIVFKQLFEWLNVCLDEGPHLVVDVPLGQLTPLLLFEQLHLH